VIALIVGKLQWEQHMEQVQSMQSCNLSHSDVFSCGDSLWLQQRLVNLNELILSNSLITSWCTVAAITSALPTLETLDISNNALQFTDADLDESQPVLSNSLAQIILNATVSADTRFPLKHLPFYLFCRDSLGRTLSFCQLRSLVCSVCI
jgi:hypothetical protein